MTLFTAEKSLKDFGDKIDASLKTSVEEKNHSTQVIKRCKQCRQKTRSTMLQKHSSAELSKIGEAMQKQEKPLLEKRQLKFKMKKFQTQKQLLTRKLTK